MAPRRSVEKAARAACIGRDRPAHRCAILGWIGRIELTRRRGSLQIPQQNARTTDRITGMNFQLAQPFERDHPTRLRHSPTRYTRPGACDRHRHPPCTGDTKNLRNFRLRLRHEHSLGRAAVTRRIRQIRRIRLRSHLSHRHAESAVSNRHALRERRGTERCRPRSPADSRPTPRA